MQRRDEFQVEKKRIAVSRSDIHTHTYARTHIRDTFEIGGVRDSFVLPEFRPRRVFSEIPFGGFRMLYEIVSHGLRRAH